MSRIPVTNDPLTAEQKRGLRFEIPAPTSAQSPETVPPVIQLRVGGDNRVAEPQASEIMKSVELSEKAISRRYRDGVQPSNPKTLMGRMKVPNLSVVPFTALIEEARAMEYGAFHSPRKDGGKGYGAFNWRDDNVEYMTYIEAAVRHIASAADREDIDPETGEHLVQHLALARATLGILIDAIHHKTVIDDRPKTARGRTAELLRQYRKTATPVSTKESTAL